MQSGSSQLNKAGRVLVVGVDMSRGGEKRWMAVVVAVAAA